MINSPASNLNAKKLTANIVNISAITTYISYIFYLYVSLNGKTIHKFFKAFSILCCVIFHYIFLLLGLYSKNINMLDNLYIFQIYSIAFSLLLILTNLKNRYYTYFIIASVGISIFQYFYLKNHLSSFIAHFKKFYFKKLGNNTKIQAAYQKYMELIVARDIFLIFYSIYIVCLLEHFKAYTFTIILRVFIILCYYFSAVSYSKQENINFLYFEISMITFEMIVGLISMMFNFEYFRGEYFNNLLRHILIILLQIKLLYIKYQIPKYYNTGLKDLLINKV